jgi:sulfite reductase beta subunit-like hemoprotein
VMETPAATRTIPSPASSPLVGISPVTRSGNGASPQYDRWAQHNLQPQRQPGYALIWIKLPSGNILTHQFRGLAEILDKYKLAVARIAISQDLVIPWTPFSRAREIFRDLTALGLATPGARTIADVTGCPGATTCNLGITRSLTLAEVLAQEFAEETDPEIKKLRIKISGCPNSCGHHHIADIGLYGNARKVGEQQAPYYQLMLGGEVSAEGVHFARQVVPIPAKRIPQALRALIELYQRDRSPNQSFRAWTVQTPDSEIVDHLHKFIDTGRDDVEDLFVDWGDQETYSLKLGRGECAA